MTLGDPIIEANGRRLGAGSVWRDCTLNNARVDGDTTYVRIKDHVAVAYLRSPGDPRGGVIYG